MKIIDVDRNLPTKSWGLICTPYSLSHSLVLPKDCAVQILKELHASREWETSILQGKRWI